MQQASCLLQCVLTSNGFSLVDKADLLKTKIPDLALPCTFQMERYLVERKCCLWAITY